MAHKHIFKETPSYTIKSRQKLELVWVCADKESGCVYVKREVKDV